APAPASDRPCRTSRSPAPKRTRRARRGPPGRGWCADRLVARAGVAAAAAAATAALLGEAVRAVDRLVAARLERHARLAAAGRADRGEHLAPAVAAASTT